MTAHPRRYRDEADYRRIREFLRVIAQDEDRPGGAWQVADFDYWRWHWMKNVVERELDDLFLWETEEGDIMAVLHHGEPGVCHFHVDPERRAEALEEAMLETAEGELAVLGIKGAHMDTSHPRQAATFELEDVRSSIDDDLLTWHRMGRYRRLVSHRP